jgi:ATP-dependent DNA ligase
MLSRRIDTAGVNEWWLKNVASHSARSTLMTSTMLWHASAPTRRPPGFIEPRLPTNGRAVPTGPQWVYEIKHDGYRFICRRDGDRV